MIKLFPKRSKAERDPYFVPRSVQQSIPIKQISKDGIFQVSGKYTKTWRFYDINYAVASPEKKQELFMKYCAFLNSLPSDATTKITLFNRRINRQDFNRSMLMHMEGDGLDTYRAEYNDILTEQSEGSNSLIQEKYITISAEKRNFEEARTFFNRLDSDITAGLARVDSVVHGLSAHERLRLFHDFFRSEEQQAFRFDMKTAILRGHDFKDAIAPCSISFEKDHYEMGNKFGRVLFLRDYATFIKDDLITKLAELPRDMMISIDLLPVPSHVSNKYFQQLNMAHEGEATRWQQRQNDHNNFNAIMPYHLTQGRETIQEYVTDMNDRDQRIIMGLVTLTHLADNMGQLDEDTKAIEAIIQGEGCEMACLQYQQEDAFNTVLPYGVRRIDAMRTLTTESTAVLMPFKSQEIHDQGGFYYGVNAVSHNLIICNRGSLLNGNGFILGVSGSGKSMAAKWELSALALGTEDDIIVVDPEREYGPLIRNFGGEVITISASSSDSSYINAMDISPDYGDGKNPLVLKSEFLMSLCEQLMDSGSIGAKEKSIIDRCTANVYREYIKDYKGDPPTLKDLHRDLMMQKEPVAHDIALALELFTSGSLDVFSHQTNIDVQNRLLCFDIQDLGENLKPIGLLVMLDAIYNRVIKNRQEGKNTHVYIDEIYLFFANNSIGGGGSRITNYSGEFLYKCWKRFRKYGGRITGITQNVEECLMSDTARMMFANSEFLMMFNQAPTDRERLSELLGISDAQMSAVKDAAAGHGLIKVGGGIVPFYNEIPKDSRLYGLMTTKPGEE